jgi:uncharacterized protein (DUF488 family)
MEIRTIGFTKHTAQQFFESLKAAKVERLIDVRLNNSSQLAAFAKRDDLRYFLGELCNIEYSHEPFLAPTQELLDAYKKQKGPWDEYASSFLDLMAQREIEKSFDPAIFERPTALLCSEHTAEHCHRRLVVEYLNDKWGDVKAIHL